MFKKSVLISSILVSALFAEQPPFAKQGQAQMQELKAQGQQASMKLIKTLGSELKRTIKKEGLSKSVEFCATKAMPMTEQVNSELGDKLSIKRISLKPRNPVNIPAEDEKRILEALSILNQEGVKVTPVVKQIDETTFKYIKPLKINKPICLKCHGSAINPQVASTIKKLYPNDSATGYHMNDLRGAIVVTIKK